MKKWMVYFSVLMVLLGILCSCNPKQDAEKQHIKEQLLIKVDSNYFDIEVLEIDEDKSQAKIRVFMPDLKNLDISTDIMNDPEELQKIIESTDKIELEINVDLLKESDQWSVKDEDVLAELVDSELEKLLFGDLDPSIFEPLVYPSDYLPEGGQGDD